MKVFITQYALTRGIFEAECEITGDMAVQKNGHLHMYFHKSDWHKTMDAAVRQAESMRTKKITSLQKQIAKLRELKFQ